MYEPTQEDKNQKTGDFRPRGPDRHKKELDAELGKKDYIVCPNCRSVYYKKGWHHKVDEDIDNLKEDKEVQFKKCPACKMIENKQFQGEIVIKEPPADKKDQMKNLIQNFGETAFEKDPMDRIISVGEKENSIRVLTTENQMAVQLAKKINQSFGNKAEVDIKYSHKDKVARVKVIF